MAVSAVPLQNEEDIGEGGEPQYPETRHSGLLNWGTIHQIFSKKSKTSSLSGIVSLTTTGRTHLPSLQTEFKVRHAMILLFSSSLIPLLHAEATREREGEREREREKKKERREEREEKKGRTRHEREGGNEQATNTKTTRQKGTVSATDHRHFDQECTKQTI